MRVGQGIDVHRFGENIGDFEIRLAGVSIPHNREILAHSDGDVAIHALCDALLGALALGDIGLHFPDSDATYKNADSCELLKKVYLKVTEKGYQLSNADITIVAEAPRMAAHVINMREVLSNILSVDVSLVSVKATTTEKLGYIGRGEGIAVHAIVLLELPPGTKVWVVAFNTDFIYAYGQPKASGSIKVEVEDFKVFEEPAFESSGSGEHTYLKIRKTNNNTAWLAGQLAEFAGIDTKDVGYAGRKDRHAVTEQWFSCYLPGENNVQWEKLDIEGVSVLEVTKHSNKLRKGDLKGNAFELILRNVTNQKSLDERLHKVQDSGVPNYFGEQRFGRANGNLVYADQLLKGSRSIRRNRDIYLSAARSYMFNHYLSSRMAADGWDAITGIDSGPLYGMSRDPRPGEESLPMECNQWCEGLQQLRVKTGARNLKLKPGKMRWRFTGSAEGPQTLQIAFSLPAGAFATSLLREVVNYSERDE